MTVVVGYLAGKAGLSALNLGVEAARTLKTSLSVVTVVPKPWTTPSPARIDAEYAQYADRLAADSAAQGAQCVATLDPTLEVSFHKYAHRSAAGGLLAAAAREQGFAAVQAVPMKLREQILGALNLFRCTPDAIPAEATAVAQSFANVATISLLQLRAL